MKKIYFIILLIGIIILIIFLLNQKQENQSSIGESKQDSIIKELELPIKQARDRITKKPFGIRISPENSPINPERFSGYHTGIDYEIFNDEENLDVEIFAICDGKLLRKEIIAGYGGVLIQECKLRDELVTVLYGHINLNSVQQEINDSIKKGDSLALLGRAFSSDTDGERKHLHLGIHKGNEINVRGYVSKKSDLNNWINFEQY